MANKKEIWKLIKINGEKPSIAYSISNHGRFGVMLDKKGNVEVRNFKPTKGYYRFNTRQKGKNKAIFLFKEVAIAFLKKPSSKHNLIIHKDHNYLNDHDSNLQWVTKKEHRLHTTNSPNSIMARKKKAINKSSHAHILNEKSVTALKKLVWDPKRKLSLKAIAEKFGVSEMQIYRIKTGQFWFHVKVENEPIHKKYKQNLLNIAYHEKKILALTAKKEKLNKTKKRILKRKK